MPALTTNAFLTSCRVCSHEFLVPNSADGRKIACPYCRAAIDVKRPEKKVNDPLVGRVVGGVELKRRLGAGALGVVYEGEQSSLGRRVAVKMLSSQAAKNEVQVKRFQREARLAAQIQHPNVVGVYDHGHEKGVHYLVMEFVEGGTFAQLIDEEGPLPWKRAIEVVVQIAEALELLASHDMIHRDVKPANILIDRDGVAKLADLGLAKQEDPSGDGSLLTMRGMMMGSPAYCAPEQARDAATCGHAADIYSLGATFFHAVTGQAPFTGRSALEVVQKVLKEDPPEPQDLVEDLPDGINDLIMDLMAKEESDRPQNPSELIDQVTKVLEAPARAARRRAARGGSPARSSSSGGGGGMGPMPIIIGIAVVVVVLIIVLAIVFSGGGTPASA